MDVKRQWQFRWIGLALVICLIAGLLPQGGCSRPSPQVEVRAVVSQVISASEGGTVVVTEEMSGSLAGLELVIPPGALPSDQKITIGEVLGGLPPHSEEYVWLGRQISLKPAGLSFATPVTLRMVFPEEEWRAWNNTISAGDMLLMKLDRPPGSWVTVPSQIREGVLTADIQSFSFWDIVIFWRPRDPASDSKIREQAERWGAPDGWGVDSRLQSKAMFVDGSKPPVSASDLTFADKIRALLLAEAMRDKIEDGNFHAGASLAKIVLQNIAQHTVEDLVKKALGIPTLGLAVSVASLTIKSSLEYLREELGAVMFNKQLRAYLSWRGWFLVKQDGQWLWTYKADLANDHQDVLTDATIPRSDDGWLMCYQRANGMIGCFGYTGIRAPGHSPEELYNLGNELCNLLRKVRENGLQADREWLRRAFAGRNMPPTATVEAPDNVEVGQVVTLRGKVTDREDDPVIWRWQQTSGPPVELVYRWSLQPRFTPTVLGVYGFALEAWDLLLENHSSASVATVVGEQPSKVYLTISSTAGGSVTTPGEGTFSYSAGTVVNLVATPASGYRFVNWTGNTATIANPNAASTTITMNSHYSITANFEEYTWTPTHIWPMFQHDPQRTGRSPYVGPKSQEPEARIFSPEGYSGFGPIAIGADGTIYSRATTSRGTGLYAFNPDGTEKWFLNVSVGGYPTIGPDGTIYALSDKGVIAVNPDKTLKWEKGIAIHYTRQYFVIGDAGTLYLVAGVVLPNGLIAAPCLVALDINGKVVWIYDIRGNQTWYVEPDYDLAPGGSAGSTDTDEVTSPSIGYDGTIYFGSLNVLYAINPDGTKKWQRTFEVVSVGHNIRFAPVISSTGILYVTVNGISLEPIRYIWYSGLYAISPDGNIIWEHTIWEGFESPPAIGPDGALYVFTMRYPVDRPIYDLRAVSTNGEVKWTLQDIWTYGIPVVDAEGNIFAASTGSSRVAGFSPNGEILWQTYLSLLSPSEVFYSTSLALNQDGTLLVPGRNKLYAIRDPSPAPPTQPPNIGVASMVAAGFYHTVGLKSDGTVVAVGDNHYGQRNVGGWSNITLVAAGFGHTVGLKSDGTVVAVGDNHYGQRNVGGWSNITQVAAGYGHTVGLKSDGTVVAVGDNHYGQCDFGGWTGITQVAAGYGHTVGLKSDGTVVAAGIEVEIAKWDLN